MQKKNTDIPGVDARPGPRKVEITGGDSRVEIVHPVVLKDAIESRRPTAATITGKFQVFRIMRNQAIIFIVDDPRCMDLDCHAVPLEGKGGGFYGRIRHVGTVTGDLRLDAPVYRITDEVLGLKRLQGNSKK